MLLLWFTIDLAHTYYIHSVQFKPIVSSDPPILSLSLCLCCTATELFEFAFNIQIPPSQAQWLTFSYAWSEFVCVMWRCFSVSICIIWICYYYGIYMMYVFTIASWESLPQGIAVLLILLKFTAYRRDKIISDMQCDFMFVREMEIDQHFPMLSSAICILDAFFLLTCTKIHIKWCTICSDMLLYLYII